VDSRRDVDAGDVVAALLGGGLHFGEAQAIAVAGELGADRLLIVIAAKVRGDLSARALHLFALRASGLWLSDGLRGHRRAIGCEWRRRG
jgi:hypothetical protein